jgi:imidazolonepropionase-like amidohydrolase
VPHRFPALIAEPARAAGRLWLTGAALFDGRGGPVRDGMAVLVEDGVIRRVASASEPCPAGARRLELGQRMLLPGLIDAHTHAAGQVPATLRGAEPELPGAAAHFLQAELRAYLRQGVTTIRVTGSQGQRPQEARQAMRYGAFRGPRLLTCAKIISATAPGGRFYGEMYREADGPDDMRRAVREQIRAGADFIKVMVTGARSNEMEDPDPLQLTEAELSAVAEETRRMGYRLAVHAEGLAGCEAAIAHGADTIEHGMYLHQRPDLLAAMAGSGQVLVPTLSGYYWMAGLGEAVDPARAGGAGRSQHRARRGQHARRTRRGRQDRAGQRHAPQRRARGPADDPSRADPRRGAHRGDTDRGAGPRPWPAGRHHRGGKTRRPADRRR